MMAELIKFISASNGPEIEAAVALAGTALQPGAVAKESIDAQAMGVSALTESRDLASSDQGRLIVSGGEWTLTVTDASGLDDWSSCVIYASGGGVTVASSVATVRVVDGKGLVIPQYGFATLTKTATANEYVLTGEMGAA